MGQFFEDSRMARQFGEPLVLACLSELKSSTVSELNKWITKELGLKSELPSSFMYPLLKKMSGGITPYLKLDEYGRYNISGDIQKRQKNGQSILGENLKIEVKEAIEFMSKLKEALNKLDKSII